MNNQPKILLITNIPNPYRIPLFNELNKQLQDLGLTLKVVFGAMGYSRRLWKIDMSECDFDYQVLASRRISLTNPEKTLFTYKGLLRVVNECQPALIITIGFSLATLKLWLRSWFITTPYIIWSGSVLHKGRFDSYLRTAMRKLMAKRARGFVAYGTKAKEYLIYLGVPVHKIEIAINTVDTAFFAEKTESIRDRLDLNKDNKRLLYVGHLNKRKNVLKLLVVVEELVKRRSDFLLDIVGDGEERPFLEKFVEDNDLAPFAHFYGFKQKEEIARFFAQTDVFLFQTDFDIWGLVLVEAMAAGLVCISSVHAMATHDLVENGVNGFVMDFSDVQQVVKKICWILDNAQSSQKIGQNAARYISANVSLEKSASGFVKAIDYASNRPAKISKIKSFGISKAMVFNTKKPELSNQ